MVLQSKIAYDEVAVYNEGPCYQSHNEARRILQEDVKEERR
jgi:hypothetical protein